MLASGGGVDSAARGSLDPRKSWADEDIRQAAAEAQAQKDGGGARRIPRTGSRNSWNEEDPSLLANTGDLQATLVAQLSHGNGDDVDSALSHSETESKRGLNDTVVLGQEDGGMGSSEERGETTISDPPQKKRVSFKADELSGQSYVKRLVEKTDSACDDSNIPPADTDTGAISAARQKEDDFIPAESGKFAGSIGGYVFKLDDRGLGYYAEGYRGRLDSSGALSQEASSGRAWNSGPGQESISQAPIGPLSCPSYKPLNLETMRSALEGSGEEMSSISYLRRMSAKVSSKAFSEKLSQRANELDETMKTELAGITKLDGFKKKTGYNLHGQRITSDGLSIVREKTEITDEEKLRQPWYRKIYGLRTMATEAVEQLDAIEERREAMACSREFMAALSTHQKNLDKQLKESLKGVLTMDRFLTKDVGSYDISGKLILSEEREAEKQEQIRKESIRRQAGEKGSTYVWQVTERLRQAHKDIVEAIAKKAKELDKEMRKKDQSLLETISQDVVVSSMGYISKTSSNTGGGCMEVVRSDKPSKRQFAPVYKGGLTISPDYVRREFVRLLTEKIAEKEREVCRAMEEKAPAAEDYIALLQEVDASQTLTTASWKRDKRTVRKMTKRRQNLSRDARKKAKEILSPWRPGGAHIAVGPWEPFYPRVRKPGRGRGTMVNGDSGGQKVTVAAKGSEEKADESQRPKKHKEYRYPDCTPTDAFMGRITAKGRRMIRTNPRMAKTFGAYKTEPFPCHSPFKDADGNAVDIDDIDRLRMLSTASSMEYNAERGRRATSNVGSRNGESRSGAVSSASTSVRQGRKLSRVSYAGDRAIHPRKSAISSAKRSEDEARNLDTNGMGITIVGGIKLVDAKIIGKEGGGRPQTAIPRPPPSRNRGSSLVLRQRPQSADAARRRTQAGKKFASSLSPSANAPVSVLEAHLKVSSQNMSNIRHEVLQAHADRRHAETSMYRPASAGKSKSEANAEKSPDCTTYIADWDTMDTEAMRERSKGMEDELLSLYMVITSVASTAISSSLQKARRIMREIVDLLRLPPKSFHLLCDTGLADNTDSVTGYVEVVSRLSTMWTLCCGVSDCAALVRKREALLADLLPGDEAQFEILISHSAAVRESINTWVKLVGRLLPWSVTVRWRGADYSSKMETDEMIAFHREDVD